MPELVLHIGTHKTGSTAIQRALRSKADELAVHGILYPASGRGRYAGHPHLAWQERNSPEYSSEAGGIDELLEEIQRYRPARVVLSSENLSLVPTDRLADWAASLAREITAQRVLVIGYVRPQWEYLESLYGTTVRTGRESAPFEDFLRANLDEPRFDYNAVFDPWAERFPGGMSLRRYGEEVVTDIWPAVGGPTEPPPMRRRPNRRLGLKAVGLCRLLNAHVDGLEIPRDALIDARHQLVDAVDVDIPFRWLTYDQACAIAQKFAEQNRRFSERYLQGQPIPMPAPFPDPPRWSLQETEPALRGVLDEVVDRLRRQVSASAGG